MTFAEYWRENEPFGSNPEDVAELAWNAATERCAKIAESRIRNDAYPYGRALTPDEAAAQIRAGATKTASQKQANMPDGVYTKGENL